MSKYHKQSKGMKALEQSLNDHMEICRLKRNAKRLKAENARLKAEVERLRKAGDAMDTLLGPCHASRQWHAAKEGRPNE